MGNTRRKRARMINMKFFCLMTLAILFALGRDQGVAQVQTDVPAVIPGAKPVTVEHIKVHGTALEGNLEGDAVDRDVLVFLPPSYAQGKIPALCRRICLARLFHWRRAMEPRDTRSANHRRRFRPGRKRDDRRAAGLEDAAQWFHVFEFGHDGRFRAVHRARSGRLHRRALPDHPKSAEPWPGRPLDGRLWRDPHRHEACRCVWQPVHHESVLLVAADRRIRKSRRRWRR